jgi:hypothetical protein
MMGSTTGGSGQIAGTIAGRQGWRKQWRAKWCRFAGATRWPSRGIAVKSLLIVILNAIALVIMPVAAQAAQPLLPDPVAFEREHFLKRCGADTTFGDDFATPRDINNDGLVDMVVNEGVITCKGEKGPDCTDEGCTYNFYLQVAEGGYFMVATAHMFSYDFIQRFGNMVLVMKMAPQYCDRSEGDPCEMTVRVRGTKFVTISKK